MDGEDPGFERIGVREVPNAPPSEMLAQIVAHLTSPEPCEQLDALERLLGLAEADSSVLCESYQALADAVVETDSGRNSDMIAASLAHAALHLLLSRSKRARAPWPTKGEVLLAALPGTHDFLGLALKGEILLRAGWDVTLSYPETETELEAELRRSHHDCLILAGGRFRTGGTEAALIGDLIARVRQGRAARFRAIIVGGRLAALRPKIAEEIGADATCPILADIAEVLERCLGEEGPARAGARAALHRLVADIKVEAVPQPRP